MKGVDVCWDVDGREARRFGVATSGHLLFYNADEELLFSGGITAVRNHEGWNVGRAAVIAHGEGRSDAERQTSVFGCPLVDPSTVRSTVESEVQK